MTEPRATDQAAGGDAGGYSKDYWDQVFEQLGKRTLFKVALAILAVLYASAIYAPLIANDRPFVLEAINYKEYGQAHRTLYPVTLGLNSLAKKSPEEYLEDRTEGSTQTFDEALSAELAAASGRVELMLSYLPEEAEGRAVLAEYMTKVEAGIAAARARDTETATATMKEVKDVAKRIRAELAPPDLDDPEAEGLELIGQKSYPLWESVSAWEIFFMVLWALVLLWPLWNRAWNALLLRGDRARIRRHRRLKWALVLGLSLLAAGGWKATIDGSLNFAAAPYKAALTSGEIVATRAVFPPVTFGFAETSSGEFFRPPTWSDKAEIDDEGYYVRGPRVPEPDVITGILPDPAPVEVRHGEPDRNAKWRRPLGTDSLGRDFLVRALWGGRISLSVGILSAAILLVIGTVVGAIAGYFGGWVDFLLSRFIELLLCFPVFFLILLVVSVVPPDFVPPIFLIVVVIGLIRWTGVARLARGEFLKLRESEFVIASEALGLSPARTIFRHILPNAMGPVLVSGAFSVAAGILTESGLSFLGFGVNEPIPSWGALVNESRNPEHWWVILFPGLLIFVTVSCYNLVGEALRDAVDPRLKD
ncbi:MAG: ABC transporter permease [Planctomycetota bacterium]